MSGQTLKWNLYKRLAPSVGATVKNLPAGEALLRRLRRAAGPLLLHYFPNPANVEGFTLHWHSADVTYGPEFLSGHYEQDTYRAVQRLLGGGMTLVDVGANIGFFAVAGARCVGPRGAVYAFEPQPHVFSLLVKNVALNGYNATVRPVQKAVAERSGARVLFQGEIDTGRASFYRNLGTVADTLTVETVSLDDFFAAQGWPAVHVIKMDIEGAEKAALDGMKELSARNPDLKLIMEFAPSYIEVVGVTPEELFATVRSLGFRKFAGLRGGVRAVSIPEEIPVLIDMASDLAVNVLCEK